MSGSLVAGFLLVASKLDTLAHLDVDAEVEAHSKWGWDGITTKFFPAIFRI